MNKKQQQLDNLNIHDKELLPTPEEIKQKLPVSDEVADLVLSGRKTIQDILTRKDHRLLLVVGPCSIHDVEAAKEYAEKLKVLAEKVKDTFFIVMRVYFEKPRTTVGWKGFINDPNLDDSFNINEGLVKARKFLLEISDLSLNVGTEALDPVIPQYIQDCITWTAIGARTTESQTHREMASGISTPVGYKNGTDGSIDIAINALKSAAEPHNFLGINQQGQCAVFRTKGNQDGHIVLRGGGSKPNYDAVSIALCEAALKAEKLPMNIVIDCSHGNSHKKPERQPLVMENCINQILGGNQSIVGFMLESHLKEGNQSLNPDRSKMEYGVSITDACMGWEQTESLVLEARETLKFALKKRAQSKAA